MIVKAIFNKSEFARCKVLDNGKVAYHFNEVEQEDGSILCDEEVINNDIEEAKAIVKQVINAYDDSSAVNNVTLKHGDTTLPYWLKHDKRDQLIASVNTFIAKGLGTYRLDIREQGTSLEVDCQKLLDGLHTMEVYASQCYNVTSDHIFVVQKLTSVEEVLSYDYRKDYPGQPTIEL